MRWLLALVLAAAAAFAGADEASACSYVLIEETFGENELSPAERERRRAADALRYFLDYVQRRRAAAEAALAAGTDAPRLLADMLVPNVRPVLIIHYDCSGPSEIDLGAGRETGADLLAGTRFQEPYEGTGTGFARALRNAFGALPGTACNAEFRERFAGHLRRRLTPAQQREAALFLAARWPSFDRSATMVRLTAFYGDARRPPARWSAEYRLHREIVRWAARGRTGRALQRAMDDFWQESAPLFGEYARLCPAAEAEWQASRARLLIELEADEARRAAAR